jgi:hypothetical protein
MIKFQACVEYQQNQVSPARRARLAIGAFPDILGEMANLEPPEGSATVPSIREGRKVPWDRRDILESPGTFAF